MWITLKNLKYIGLFYRIRKYLSQKSLAILYTSLVLPRIDYCDNVWGNCGKLLGERIERLQTRSARAILRKPIRTSSDYLRQKMGWETLEKRREYHLNLSVFKCLSGLVPNALCNVFTLVGILIVCLLALVRMVRLGRLDHLLSMENALFNIGGHFLGTSSEIQSLLLYQPVPVFSSVNIIQSQSLIQSSNTFVHTQMSCAKKNIVFKIIFCAELI